MRKGGGFALPGLAHKAKGSASGHMGGITAVALGALSFCGVATRSAIAQGMVTQGLSATETLNAQQLRALSAPSRLVNCGHANGVAVGAPRSLPDFVEQAGRVGGPDGSPVCGGSGIQQVPLPGWTLFAGELVGQQIIGWGQGAGWHVIWRYGKDWTVPQSVQFQGDFTSAASQVLEDLAAEGASIQGVFYQGNHTLVITGGSQ